MANPLQSNMLSAPPAPNPQPQDPMQGAPVNALQQGPAPGNGPQQGAAPPNAPQQPPAPTHAQTVAALRHFHAITQELEALASDPDLGKADIKSKAIDGATKLVGMRILSPSQAVMQLGEFPTVPFQQKQWVAKQLSQAQRGANFVLDHHRVAHAGVKDMPQGSPDDHMQDMAGMMSAHYNGGGRG